MKTISVSLFNRPDYTKQVLNALEKCTGIEEYHIFIRAEPGDSKEIKETISIANSFSHSNKNLIVNPKRLGCGINIWSCLDTAFSKTNTDFHIHFEDDTVPSKDCLKYFEWVSNYYKKDKDVAVSTCYSKISNVVVSDKFKNAVKKIRWFIPWGWGLWRDTWENVLKEELFNRITKSKTYLSWDGHTNNILEDHNLSMSLPILSRSQNIGALNGVHCPGEEFHKQRQWTELFVDDLGIYEKEFYEVIEPELIQYTQANKLRHNKR
jgi:hypothetical protein